MSLRIALQMDPLESINPKTDTTLRLGIEAQARGHTLWHYTPDQLSWREGKVMANATRVTLRNDVKDYHTFGAAERIDLSTMDVVLLRQDPPFNMAYITTTYLLEQLQPGTLVVNHPGAVRDLPEKWLPTFFAEYMPPTLISSHVQDILAFYNEHKDIVIKPLYGYGGHGVFRLPSGAADAAERIKASMPADKEPVMAQLFLPEVKTEDRRVIIIDGDIAATFGRIPAEGDIRANMRVGGTAVKAAITPRQRQVCEKLGPFLKERGLLLAGVDFIGDWLTEVNITCPTGFSAVTSLYGINLAENFWNAVEKQIPAKAA